MKVSKNYLVLHGYYNFLISIADDSDQWASQDSTELSIDQQMSSKNIYTL